MGGAYCWVPYCRNQRYSQGREQKLSFHKLPSDETLRSKWLSKIGRKIGPNTHINEGYARVCSDHFQPGDFYSGYLSGRRELKEGVVPSIFPWKYNVTQSKNDDSEETLGDEEEPAGLSSSDVAESDEEELPVLTRLKQTPKQRGEIRDELCEAWRASACTDVTLFCGEKQVEAHRLILASASPFLKSLLEEVDDHADLIMVDFRFEDILNLLQLLYNGCVFVTAESAIGVQKLCQSLNIEPGKQDIKLVQDSTEEPPVKKQRTEEFMQVFTDGDEEIRVRGKDGVNDGTEQVESIFDFFGDDESSECTSADTATNSDEEDYEDFFGENDYFECQVCHAIFPTENLLEAHRSLHDDDMAADESRKRNGKTSSSESQTWQSNAVTNGRPIKTYSAKKKKVNNKELNADQWMTHSSFVSDSSVNPDPVEVGLVQLDVEEWPAPPMSSDESENVENVSDQNATEEQPLMIVSEEQSEALIFTPPVDGLGESSEVFETVEVTDESGSVTVESGEHGIVNEKQLIQNEKILDDQSAAASALCLLNELFVEEESIVVQSAATDGSDGGEAVTQSTSDSTPVETYMFERPSADITERIEGDGGNVQVETHVVQDDKIDGSISDLTISHPGQIIETYVVQDDVLNGAMTYVLQEDGVTEEVVEQVPYSTVVTSVSEQPYEVVYEHIQTEVITDMPYLETGSQPVVEPEQESIVQRAFSAVDVNIDESPMESRALPVVVSVTANTSNIENTIAEMNLPKLVVIRRRAGQTRKRVYPCCYCDYESDTAYGRMKHLADHDERATCPECNEEFPAHELEKHVDKIHVKGLGKCLSETEKTVESILAGMRLPKLTIPRLRSSKDNRTRIYPCCYCSLVCDSREERIEHLRTHDVPLTCPVCNKSVQAHEMLQHVTKDHVKSGVREPCQLCGQYFLGMKKHILSAHKDQVKVEQKCKLCPELSFYSDDDLRSHYECRHFETKVLCEICGIDFFPFEAKMHKHREDDGPKTCYICGKTVKRLVRHIAEVHEKKGRKNDRERISLQCEKCPKIVFSYATLRKHMLKHHNDTGYPACLHCEKYFETEEMLNIHKQQAHQKSYSECAICRETLPSLALPKHVLDHAWNELEPDFSPINQDLLQNVNCPRCGASFPCTAYLANHLVGHLDPSRTFECDACFKCFRSEKRLAWHKDLICKTPEEVKEMKRLHSRKAKEKAKERKLMSGGLIRERKRGRKSKQEIVEYETEFACMLCEEQFGSYDLCRDHMYSVHDSYDSEVE